MAAGTANARSRTVKRSIRHLKARHVTPNPDRLPAVHRSSRDSHKNGYNSIRRLPRAAQTWSAMSNKVKAAILVASAGVLLFTLVGTVTGVHASNDGAYKQMEVYSEVLSRV